jgi:ADP-ribose diphosphatase
MTEPTEPTTLYVGRHLSMVAHGHWEYATRNTKRPAVAIVAVTDEGQLVLVEQYRIPMGRSVVELPAGLAGDVAGAEDKLLVEAAKRELLEETGYAASRWTELVHGCSSPGLSDESIVLFLATGLEKHTAGGGDASEQITVHEVPVEKVLDWLKERAAMVDFKLFAGVLLAQQHLQR